MNQSVIENRHACFRLTIYVQSAIGVAFFPTTPEDDHAQIDRIIGYAHYGFAAAFFLTLAYFCLVLFRKTDPTSL